MTEQDMQAVERAARMAMALDDGGSDEFLEAERRRDAVSPRFQAARPREKSAIWSAGALLMSLPFTR